MSRALLAKLCWAAFGLFLVCGGQAFGQGQPYLDPLDAVLAIDETGLISLSNHPAAENPPKILDNMAGTKYLNFGETGSGFIVTPAATDIVESFQIRTANDAPSRDPASWELYGFTGALVSTNNSLGNAEAWTLIGSGGLALPGDPTMNLDQRGVLGPVVDVPTAIGYQHYKMYFPTVKDSALANSLQLADIQFYKNDAATAGNEILAAANPILAVHSGGQDSRYPAAESPAKALDDAAGTKYLNFGKEKSGLIVTNAQGAQPLHSIRLTTANDAPNRDPSSYQLYGTNDPIQSVDNNTGNGGETWTLLSSGGLTLPAARGDASTLVEIESTTPYASYKLVFPTLKDPLAAGVDSMQVADIQFYAVPEPSTFLLTVILAAAGMVGMRRR